MSAIFAAPVPAALRAKNPSTWTVHGKKRKRDVRKPETLEQQEQDEEQEEITREPNIEYSAVVTPNERSQRRLAGWPIDRNPPTLPFPHASPGMKADKEASESSATKIQYPRSGARESSSLHVQHISALTTLLHRCLLKQDFRRARRALSLILREEIDGSPVDIRKLEHWGIGAELLLRSGEVFEQITMQGFIRAKGYYERLILQYPYHKQFSERTNSIDFYLALFNIWIYVINIEGAANSGLDNTSEEDSMTSSVVGESQSRQQTLEHATEVEERLDACMSRLPYSDDKHLIRLRAMVAFWVADLIDAHQRLLSDTMFSHTADINTIGDVASEITNPEFERSNNQFQAEALSHSNEGLTRSQASRDLGQRLLERLYG